jgi:hypothetical protein
VPNATIVKPMTFSETPKASAMIIALSTKKGQVERLDPCYLFYCDKETMHQ